MTQRPWVRIPLKPRKHFSGLLCDCLNRNHNCDDHIRHTPFIYSQSYNFFLFFPCSLVVVYLRQICIILTCIVTSVCDGQN